MAAYTTASAGAMLMSSGCQSVEDGASDVTVPFNFSHFDYP